MTDGSEPIGRGIGPALEMRDVMAVLRGDADAPLDLRDKALKLSGRLLELDPEVPGGQGEARAREILTSGDALKKMEQIAEAQGPSPVSGALGDLVHEVVSPSDGWIDRIDCLQIARLARLAGAPTDAGSGIDLLKRKGDNVRAGEPLYRIHGVDRADFAYATSAADAETGFHIL